MKYFIVLFLSHILFLENLKAQEDYYTKYNKELRIEAFLNNNNSIVNINIPDKFTHELKTNTRVGLGVAVKYKWLILPITLINSSQIKDSITIRSKIFNFAPELYIKGIVLGGVYHSSKGFYYYDKLIRPDDTINVVYNLPETKYIQKQAFGFYVFNHKKFNLKALNAGTAMQLKSAGSFVLGTYYNQTQVLNFSPIYSNYRSNSFGLLTGYLHNFVFWKKRANAGIGIMPQFGYLKANSFISQKSNFDYRLQNRLNLSFNFKAWYFGALGQFFIENQSQEIHTSNNALTLYIGFKFLNKAK